MPAVKVTLLMQHVSNFGEVAGGFSRIGGWSETWYKPGTDVVGARNLVEIGNGSLPPIAQTRAALLPQGSAIVGQRYQIVDPRGPAQSASRFFNGNGSFTADVPQMGLLCKIGATGVGNIRAQIIRAIPDSFVQLGEFAPSVAYRDLVLRYFGSLVLWNFRGRDLTIPAFTIISISSAGLVTTTAAHGYAINDRVRILKTLTAAGRVVGALAYVSTVPSTTTFTLNVWTNGSSEGGTVRKEVIIYPPVNPNIATISRIVTRRVGRPFVQYRGRRARRSS